MTGKRRLMFALLAPLMFIPLVGFGYAKWTNTITVVSYMQSGDESIRITRYSVTYYNGYGDFKLEGTEDTIFFEDNNIFPGWELELLVEIHNDGTVPVYISYQIYYWDRDQTDWVQVSDPPMELYDKFRIVYTDWLHDEVGEPWDPEIYLWPCETVSKIERILFDAQDRPDLQDETFTIKVEILGSVMR